MKRISDLTKRLDRINLAFLMKRLFMDVTFRQMIISLNTRSQLYDEGIDSKGRKLDEIGGGYSQATIEGTNNYKGKLAKGQPIDRITLYDTGEFYESFSVKLFGSEIKITANTMKEDTDLRKEWGNDIIGLTDESMNILINYARNIIVPDLRKYLLAA